MSEMQRVSILGGETNSSSVFGAKVTNAQGVAAIVAGIVWLATVLIVRGAVVTVTGGLLVVVVFVVVGRATSEGDSWLRSTYDAAAAKWTLWRRGGRWHREMGLPAVVGQMRELVYRPAPEYRDVAVGFLHQRHHRHGYGPKSSLTAVVEIVGVGDGIRDLADYDRNASRFSGLLALAASPSSPVQQIDLETRVMPTHRSVYEAYFSSLLAPDCPPALRTSMDELGALGAENTETYRSYATIRFDRGALSATVTGQVTEESMAEAAGDALREVVRRLEAADLSVRNVLNPAQVGAMIRHMYVPAFKVEATAGITRATDGWAWPYENHRDYVRVDGPPMTDPLSGEQAGSWFHAVATIPATAFPTFAVTARWLSGLVTDVHPSPIRTVKVQHKLIPRTQARQRAISRLTSDAATMASDARKARLSTGVAESSASVQQLVLDDLVHERAAGVQSLVHVLVSGRTPAELKASKAQLVQAAQEMGVERLKWHHWRHHTAMMLIAPLGRGF